MTEQEFYRESMCINSANLAANIENVNINTEILERSKKRDDLIITLLSQLLEVLKNDSE
jgi:hypothetical protein